MTLMRASKYSKERCHPEAGILFQASSHSVAAHMKGTSGAIPLGLLPGPILTSLLFPVLLPSP